jgi:hypothetical protein
MEIDPSRKIPLSYKSTALDDSWLYYRDLVEMRKEKFFMLEIHNLSGI